MKSNLNHLLNCGVLVAECLLVSLALFNPQGLHAAEIKYSSKPAGDPRIPSNSAPATTIVKGAVLYFGKDFDIPCVPDNNESLYFYSSGIGLRDFPLNRHKVTGTIEALDAEGCRPDGGMPEAVRLGPSLHNNHLTVDLIVGDNKPAKEPGTRRGEITISLHDDKGDTYRMQLISSNTGPALEKINVGDFRRQFNWAFWVQNPPPGKVAAAGLNSTISNLGDIPDNGSKPSEAADGNKTTVPTAAASPEKTATKPDKLQAK